MDFLLVLLITFNYFFQDSTEQYAPPQSNLISSIAEWRTFDHSNNFTIYVKQFYSSRYNRFKWIINDESSVIWSLNENQLKYIFPARIDGRDVWYMNEVKKPFAMEHPAIYPFPDLNEYFCRRENPHYYPHSYICVREIPRGLPSVRTTVWIEDSYGKVIKNVIYEELNSGKQISTKYNLLVYEEPDESVWDIPPNVVQFRPRDGTQEGELAEELLTWKYLLGRRLIWPDEKHINNRMATQPILGESNTRSLGKFHQHQSSFPYDPSEYDNIRYPEFLDWERCGKVSPVKDQDICSACTTFAAVDSLQSAHFINNGIWVDMSVQAVIDCSWGEPRSSKPHFNMGCFSGHIDATFEWVFEKGGIPKTQQYGQFKGVNGKCKLPIFNDGSFDLVAPIESYTKVPQNVNAMKMALFRHGPVAVSLTGNEIRDKVYQPNVIIVDKPLWNATLSHAALLVGYGVHPTGVPYWKVKNSWGLNWGERGYFYVGITNNSLRLLDEAYYANVENHNYARTYCDICGCPNYVD